MSIYHYSSINSKLSNSPSPMGICHFSSLECCKYTKVGKASRFIQKPTHLAGLSSGRLIMNSGWIWNSHERNTFLRAEASRDILKFRVSKMALKVVFKRCFPPQTPCCSVKYAQDWEQCRQNVPGIPRFTDLDLNLFKYAFNVIQNWETVPIFCQKLW